MDNLKSHSGAYQNIMDILEEVQQLITDYKSGVATKEDLQNQYNQLPDHYGIYKGLFHHYCRQKEEATLIRDLRVINKYADDCIEEIKRLLKDSHS